MRLRDPNLKMEAFSNPSTPVVAEHQIKEEESSASVASEQQLKKEEVPVAAETEVHVDVVHTEGVKLEEISGVRVAVVGCVS